MKKLFVTSLLCLSLLNPLQAEAKPMVTMKTSLGEIVIELDTEKAPKSSENFMQYVKDGHYDGTIFHRVIDGFMVQGGGYTADYTQKPTRAPVANEADNGLKNEIGTVAMARTSDPQSATAQFFINVANNSFLNFSSKSSQGWGYAVFGKVVKGMDIVEQIKSKPTGSAGPFAQDAPLTPIVIEKCTIAE